MVVPGLAPIPKFTKEEKLFTFKVVVVIVVAKRFVVVRAFDMTTFPRTYKLVVPGLAPIPMACVNKLLTKILVAKIFVAKIFVVVRAFDMTTFPRTYRFARPGEVPIPRLEVIKSVPVLIEVALMEVANRFVVVRALLA